MERLKTLAAKIHEANLAYHGRDKPIMPDAAYDALRRDYRQTRKALLLGFAERFAQAAAELRDAKPQQGDLFG